MTDPALTGPATGLIETCIRDSAATLERLLEGDHVERIERAAEMITASMRDGGKLLIFGNGGSAADATHIAAEFLGRFLLEREALPALSLSDNSSTLTAIGNDYAYEDVFSRQVAGLGVAGDVAIAISTSGNSANVLAGVQAAHQRGMRTIALTGGTGGELASRCDIALVVPDDRTPRIQEGHILVAHILCEIVERELAAGA